MQKTVSPFIALQFIDFQLLVIAVLIGQLGMQMQLVAINWHMYLLTHSTIYLGFLGIAGFLPVMAFSLVSGVLADRMNRKHLFLTSQIIVGLSALTLFAATVMHSISPWIIYIVTIVNALAAAVNVPAKQAMIPSLVPRDLLRQALGMHSMVWQTAIIGGPTVGGFLIALYGVQSVYLFNTCMSFFACIVLLNIQFHFEKQEHHILTLQSSFHSIQEGIRFVLNAPMIYATMLLDFFATFFASASVLMPVFAKDILRVGPQGVGLLYAAPAVGGIIAGLVLSSIHKLHKQGVILLSGVLLYGFATIGFGISRIFILSLFFLVLSGAGDMISAVVRNTIRQLMTPDHLRGRMIAINMNFFLGGPYLGDIEAGLLASAVGTPISVVVGGIATVVLSLLVTAIYPKLRSYNHEDALV